MIILRCWKAVRKKKKEHHLKLTTRPSTRLRTRSPISGDMSLPNCCSVVRKRFSLHSCRAPQAGGSCWLESEAVDDMAGPLLKPLGVDGAPFRDVGEWLLPFSTTHRQDGDNTTVRGQRFDRIPTKSGQAKKKNDKVLHCIHGK